MCGRGGMSRNSTLSTRLCCEPKTTLKGKFLSFLRQRNVLNVLTVSAQKLNEAQAMETQISPLHAHTMVSTNTNNKISREEKKKESKDKETPLKKRRRN